MRVTLINYTQDAAALLILAKNTRTTLIPELFPIIKAMSPAQQEQELDYIAKTIPNAWEFVDYTFLIEGVSRAFTHQFVRTRTGSYAQQAMRVTKMTEDKHGYDFVYDEGANPETRAIMQQLNAHIANVYDCLLQNGVATEIARGILPTNIATNIMAKFNLRALAQLINSRSSKRVQPEFRSVISAMYDEVIKVHPWANKFIFPNGKDYFQDLESFAETLDAEQRIPLLKIVDKMRGH